MARKPRIENGPLQFDASADILVKWLRAVIETGKPGKLQLHTAKALLAALEPLTQPTTIY